MPTNTQIETLISTSSILDLRSSFLECYSNKKETLPILHSYLNIRDNSKNNHSSQAQPFIIINKNENPKKTYTSISAHYKAVYHECHHLLTNGSLNLLYIAVKPINKTPYSKKSLNCLNVMVLYFPMKFFLAENTRILHRRQSCSNQYHSKYQVGLLAVSQLVSKFFLENVQCSSVS